MLADAYAFAVFYLVRDAGSLAALGANHLHLAGVKRGFLLDYATLLSLLAGLYMTGDDIDALDQNLALAGDGGLDLAGLALVLAGQDDNIIALFDVHKSHCFVPLK
ncbi:hypothetical protein SDC9_208902 [bioreactor metagenome]|uniref:Uncharacterized protein n=1 Tax=bioreactor metagenome TaxID=1076179 RepID=A0A645JBV1_9ZZZZ